MLSVLRGLPAELPPCANLHEVATNHLDPAKYVPGIIIFIFSFMMISRDKWVCFPIGRTGGTLLGAMMMLASKVISPPQATESINLDVLALLFGSTLMTQYLEEEGCLDFIAAAMGNCSPRVLLVRITFISAIVSSLITNDTCCVVFTPLVVTACERQKLPLAPYLLALASSANIGAALTPIGSPQSMIIASHSGLNFVDIFVTVGPAVLVSLIVNCMLLVWMYGAELDSAATSSGVQGQKLPAEQGLQQQQQQQQPWQKRSKAGFAMLHQNSIEPESNNGIMDLEAGTNSSADGDDDFEERDEDQGQDDGRMCMYNPNLMHTDASSPMRRLSSVYGSHVFDLKAQNQGAGERDSTGANSSSSSSSSDSSSNGRIGGVHVRAPAKRSHFSTMCSTISWRPASSRAPTNANTVVAVQNRCKSTSTATRHDNIGGVVEPPLLATTQNALALPTCSSDGSSDGSGDDGDSGCACVALQSTRRWSRSVHRALLALGVVFCLVGFLAGLPLGWTAVAGAVWMMVVSSVNVPVNSSDTFRDSANANLKIQKNNWPLLVFFASLFVVMRGVQETNIVAVMWQGCPDCTNALHSFRGLAMFTAAVAAGSNIVSNVPFVLMLVPEIHAYAREEQRLPWMLLLWVSSVAGNLTLVGSVANLIVAERAKECSSKKYDLTFFEYLRFGVPSTLLVLLLGTACTSFTAASVPRFSPIPPVLPPPPHMLVECAEMEMQMETTLKTITNANANGNAKANDDFETPVNLYKNYSLVPTSGDRPGLFFIGLSLSRNHAGSNTASRTSVSRQTQFDFNKIQDRDYAHVQATNDDGWLVGGGESAASYKLPNPDSAHIEILHVGTPDPARGGMSFADIDAILSKVEFAPIRVKPSNAALNGYLPPEWELRFAKEDNPTLEDVQTKLLEQFHNRLRELPDRFHMSIARKVGFRSPAHRREFLANADEEVGRWRAKYPKGAVLTPDLGARGVTDQEKKQPGGIYLFSNRNTILKYYPPTTK